MDIASAEHAAALEASAPTSTRSLFEIPRRGAIGADSEPEGECIYMAGNSLGLLPKKARQIINEELDVWSNRAVMGHFDHPHARPWKDIDAPLLPGLAALVGALESEVACTSTLTSNLHSLFVSFYRPEKGGEGAVQGGKGLRRKILVEGKAFPSDQYAVQSHLDLHGISREDGLVELWPREGEVNLRTEDVLRVIEEQGDEIALLWLSGVQYYTGQFFAMERITAAGKRKGCVVGWDLAHAAGNVELKLHDWGVDFAVWCHYKYLNSGAGAVAGLFVHSSHTTPTSPSASSSETAPSFSSPSGYTGPRLAGWWGHSHATRFDMPPTFEPIEGAGGWQHSNPPMLSVLPLYAALEAVASAGGLPALRERSVKLTGYLWDLLTRSRFYLPPGAHAPEGTLSFTILTPEGADERGAQLSLAVREGSGEKKGVMIEVFERLRRRGVLGDERKPDVIRISPTPLYNTFPEVRLVARFLEEALAEVSAKLEAGRA